MWRRWIHSRQAKSYKKQNFDLAQFEQLSKQIQEANRQLEAECNTFYGTKTVPAFVQEAIAARTAQLVEGAATKKQ